MTENTSVVEVVLLHLPSIQGTLDTGETVEEFARNYFDFKHDFVGYVAIIIAGMATLFGFIFAYSIRVFNFQKR
ncbi:hypothetical protein CsSME_00049113 [Camellia sinensis var. sinensis]